MLAGIDTIKHEMCMERSQNRVNNQETGIRDFVVRPAEKEDIAFVLDMIHELAVYEHMEDQAIATAEGIEEAVFVRQNTGILIGEYGGEKVGYALYFTSFSTFLGRNGIYLEDLYIRQDMRHRGFGKAMLRALASMAVEKGYGRLEWSCLDWNQPSIDFYLSLDAEPLSDWTMYRLTGESLRKMAGK